MNIIVKNICGDFLRFWEEACKAETLEEKKALWNKIYEEPNKDIFDIYYNGFGNRKNLDAAIIEKLPTAIERIKKLNIEIESKIKEVTLKCSELFHTDDIDFNYVIMVGTFSSNGWGCFYNNKPTVFFAVEFDNDLDYFDIFLSHEITHNFHMNINKIDDANANLAYLTLEEGLAVVASKTLYPGFADTVYLNFGLYGDAWLRKCRDIFYSIKDEYILSLTSNENETIRKYFFGRISEDKPVPNRIGYVIGYNIVSVLVKNYSFHEIASWNLEEALYHVKKVLGSNF